MMCEWTDGNWQALFFLCLSDELFQKVAEDYNNTAFQYMTGECFMHTLSL